MRAKHVSVAALAAAAAIMLGSGAASAHPVGSADEPNCHGQRVSHGANHSPIQEGHGLTPVERRDQLIEFGVIPADTTLGEWNKFVKECPPPN